MSITDEVFRQNRGMATARSHNYRPTGMKSCASDEERSVNGSIGIRHRSRRSKSRINCRAAIIITALILYFVCALRTLGSIDIGDTDRLAVGPMGGKAAIVPRKQPLSLQRQGKLSTTTNPPKNHTNAIPNTIIFTHYRDILHEKLQFKDSNNLTKGEAELQALQLNVRNSVRMHPGAIVRFLTDDDCLQILRNVMSNPQDSLELADYFERETEGMFKGDLCRGAALFQSGGLYFDVDLGVRQNIFELLQNTTEFATIRVHLESTHRGDFFQAFIGSTPQHPVLLRYLELFLSYARGDIRISGPLGVILLRRAYDEIMGKLPKQDEKHLVILDQKRHVEVWQEFRYKPEFQSHVLSHVPPPVWGGTKRACKFVVLASQIIHPLVVPFYSRVAGSRMCPSDEIDSRFG